MSVDVSLTIQNYSLYHREHGLTWECSWLHSVPAAWSCCRQRRSFCWSHCCVLSSHLLRRADRPAVKHKVFRGSSLHTWWWQKGLRTYPQMVTPTEYKLHLHIYWGSVLHHPLHHGSDISRLNGVYPVPRFHTLSQHLGDNQSLHLQTQGHVEHARGPILKSAFLPVSEENPPLHNGSVASVLPPLLLRTKL